MINYKKIISLLLTLVLVIGLVPITDAKAADVSTTADGWEYTIANGKVTIKGHTNPVGALEIPAIIEGYPVTSIGDRAFRGCSSLTSVVIPDSVTSIGDYAFYDCNSLMSVVIPDSVTSIGDEAFKGSGRPHVFYSGTAEQWPEISFGIGNTELTGSSTIRHYDVTEYSITSKETCSGTLYHCSLCNKNFEFIEKSTPTHFFSSGICTKCGVAEGWKYTINANAKVTISGHANPVGALTIPATIEGCPVTMIRGDAFRSCSSLTSITIPDSVTSIGGDAFYGCSSLTSITIPDSVTSIGAYAFYGCSSLTSVVIGDSVTYIGIKAFRGCSSLTSITIPDSVTSMGDDAFYGCSSLTSVVIGDSVTRIGSWAFYNCSSLVSVVIGDSVTSISNDAFYCCSNLSHVYYRGTAWNAIAIYGDNENLTNATRHSNVIGDPLTITTTCSGTLYHCSLCNKNFEFVEKSTPTHFFSSGVCTKCGVAEGWKYTITNDGIVTIKGHANPVGALEIPNTIEGYPVASVGNNAFRGCSSLTSITIPDSVTSIGNEAFYSCDSLVHVFYRGSQAQWDAMSIGYSNTDLTDAIIHYNYGTAVFGDWKDTGDTTYHYRYCQDDGCTVTEKEEHDWDAGVVTTQPTCETAGETTYTCSECDATKTEPVANIGHDYGDWTDTGDDEYHYQICANDPSHTEKEEHDWDAGVITTAPTCKEDGVKTYTCSVCNATKTEAVTLDCPSAHFTDVAYPSWYHNAVDYALTNGLMNGTAPTKFNPNGELTRAQLATVLYNLEGNPAGDWSNPFTDVKPGWYYNAVCWAAANGITSGTSATTFSPNVKLTREQLVTMLYSYANYKGYDTDSTTSLSQFRDAGKISNWAKPAVSWAVAEGYISGTTPTTVAPKTVASRAQLAQIMYKFCENNNIF